MKVTVILARLGSSLGCRAAVFAERSAPYPRDEPSARVVWSGIENICCALIDLVQRFEDAVIVYPVHLNPNVQDPVQRLLGRKKRIHLLKPLGYLELISLMERAHIVLTDSGGLQEELPSFDKPILILRDVTERPEVVESGCARLVGTSRSAIVDNATELMSDSQSYCRMARAKNPFGDGRASERIVAQLLDGRRCE